MSIEKQLNDSISSIESMEGQLNRLNSQIDYSTISIYASLPYLTTDDGAELPPFLEDLRNLGMDILYLLSNFVIGLLFFIIVGIPVVLVIALLYWLLVGKIGLLRKLFTKLSQTKE